MCPLASSALRAFLFGSKSYAHITARQCILPSKRHFLVTPRLSNSDDPTKAAQSQSDHVDEEATTFESTIDTSQEPEGDNDDPDGSQAPSRPRDLSGYGSAARRAGRHIKKPKELPPFLLPSWFLERNVFLREELSKLAISPELLESGADRVERSSPTIATEPKTDATSERIEKGAQEHNTFHQIGSPVRSYEINENILCEISSLIRTGLGSAHTANSETWVSSKADLLLYHPKLGGSFYLDELVTCLAATHGADLIRLDPQDIADIGGSYVDDLRDTHSKSLNTLGYDVYLSTFRRPPHEDAPYAEEASEEDDAREEQEDDDERSQHFPRPFGSGLIIPISKVGEDVIDAVSSVIATSPTFSNSQKSPFHANVFGQIRDMTRDMKISSFIENTLNASEKKREFNQPVENYQSLEMGSMPAMHDVTTDVTNDPKELTDAKINTDKLILVIKDYVEIQSVSAGAKLLAHIHDIVRNRRKDGQRIMIIGTSSSEHFGPAISRDNVLKIQSEPRNSPVRTILTPSRTLQSQDLTDDHRLKVALINLRNIQDMLRRLSPHPTAVDRLSVQDLVFQIFFNSRMADSARIETMETVLQRELGCEKIYHKLKRFIWPLDIVHHVATVALGLNIPWGTGVEDSHISMRYVIEAVRLLTRSQAAKYKWIEDGQEEHENRMESTDRPLPDSFQGPFAGWSTSDRDSRMKNLRRICNTHERKLLSGVVDPQSIRTTFADVQVPRETISTLKNLTSLSLVRPEAFTYGVLATDKIPGLLLYGPPGTGKSLLARATAKESGATVLEVSGAGS